MNEYIKEIDGGKVLLVKGNKQSLMVYKTENGAFFVYDTQTKDAVKAFSSASAALNNALGRCGAGYQIEVM